jgi:alpha-mannosidase
MLRTTFTPYIGLSKASYEIPFGAIQRTADGREVPALRWADISDDTVGITLANNCKYGHFAQGNTLALTLVRASYEPDNNPDERLHHFTYSIIPHAGPVNEMQAITGGSGLNQPLVTVVEGPHSGSIKPGQALLTCDSDSVIISAVKFAEDQPSDSKALIVRLFESKGKPAKATLSAKWSITKAEEVNMLEEQGSPIAVNGNSISLDFGKNEIKTVKVFIK